MRLGWPGSWRLLIDAQRRAGAQAQGAPIEGTQLQLQPVDPTKAQTVAARILPTKRLMIVLMERIQVQDTQIDSIRELLKADPSRRDADPGKTIKT